MSAIVSNKIGDLGLHRPVVQPARATAIRERAIDAACLLLSVIGAGTLALVLLAATELPSGGAAPLKVSTASVLASHS